MIGTLSRETRVLVQGITGRMGRTHAGLMRAYGTTIVAGTGTPGTIDGVPVFADPAAAVAATGAEASVLFTPPAETLAAGLAAIDAGIRLLVTVAEGVPAHDAIRLGLIQKNCSQSSFGRLSQRKSTKLKIITTKK